MNVFMGIAIYFVLWWLAFFTMLPIGAQSAHEAGEEVPAGSDSAAPRAHGLGKKALWASGIASILWLGVFWAVSVDLIGMYGR